MKGMMIFADGFEAVEGIATVDVLRRAGLSLDLISMNVTKEVMSSSQVMMTMDMTIDSVDYTSYDFLILPGGPAVFQVLDGSYLIAKIISWFCNHKKLVCAICAAPSLLGKLGYLREKHYTVFPGCGDKIVHGTLSDDPVVVDGNIITARSMYYTCDFALKIISSLLGDEQACQIKKQIQGL